MICNINNAVPRSKMAGFDFDFTLFKPKNNKIFFENINDWELMDPSIPYKLHRLLDNNYMIVVFTNYLKNRDKYIAQAALESLNIPLFLVVPDDCSMYKPHFSLYNNLIDYFMFLGYVNYKIDIGNSFYVGDAMGRNNDFFDYDRIFAENLGIRYYFPERFYNMVG
jgi:bifunctional polynucleotide phosphatase/kinase